MSFLGGGSSGGGGSGSDGLSAYEVAVANGFVGTEEEWLASLVGATGNPAVGNLDGGAGSSVAVLPALDGGAA